MEQTKCVYCLRRLCLSDMTICQPPCECQHVWIPQVSEEEYSILTENPFHWKKLDATLKDPQSTGRKRAAKLYPLDPDANCEWSMTHFVGGGERPIPGCGLRTGTVIGKQQHRHHGPDYSTINNAPGNVHRICFSCHNLPVARLQ